MFLISTALSFLLYVLILYIFLFFFFFSMFSIFTVPSIVAEPVRERPTPCTPSPCGANAICREQNGAGSCSCIEDYQGNPYEGCRPECILNTDCPSNRACIRNKCQDPCPGTCGQNAVCQVVNHLPSCTCQPGYSGDPFRHCTLIPERRQDFFKLFLCSFSSTHLNSSRLQIYGFSCCTS